MNNVKKNFQTKSMLRCMADGGLVRNNDDFNGPQRAVDAMAEGRDPNEDRRAKANWQLRRAARCTSRRRSPRLRTSRCRCSWR